MADAATVETAMRVIKAARSCPDLFQGALLEALHKVKSPTMPRSNQGRSVGRKAHPFDMKAPRKYRRFNTTHSACIEAKRAATVGHGHKSSDVSKVLSPLCERSWQDLLDKIADDFWNTGNGYIEVVRGNPRDQRIITGLHHIQSPNVWVDVESTPQRDFHFEVISSDSTVRDVHRRFARFGDLQRFRRRAGRNGERFGRQARGATSEVIHWAFPTTESRYYGIPEYFSAVPSIELVQAMTQHEFNFFFNYGVPEFLLFILGPKLSKSDWEQVETVMKSGQGVTNGHQSGAFNFDVNPELIRVQVERLAMIDGGEGNKFRDHSQVTAMNICSAHGTPPSLAQVLIPGKMGANNEQSNNLMVFQIQKVAPAQRSLSELLACTLGAEQTFATLDGGTATLTPEDFSGSEEDKGNGFNTVTEMVSGMRQEEAMQAMENQERMRTEVGDGDRDPADGLRRNGQDRERTGGRPAANTQS